MASCDENEKAAFAQTLKLALATSIIRTKPEHFTAKEYARELARKLKETENSWKAKYEDTRKDLDKAKQEIVLLKLQSNDQYTEHKGEQKLEADGRDGTKNDDLLSIVVTFRSCHNKLDGDDGSLNMIKKKMSNAMNDIDSSLKNIRLDDHSMRYMEMNFSLLKDMLKYEKFSTDPSIIQRSSDIIRTTVTLLMNSQSSEITTKEKLTTCLNKLSRSCVMIRDVVMKTLVLVISGYTALLKELPSFTCLNVDKYDNIGYVCKLLKDVIASCSQWPCDKLLEYSEYLDDGLVEISGNFLLYAQTVWTISSLLVEMNFQVESNVVPDHIAIVD